MPLAEAALTPLPWMIAAGVGVLAWSVTLAAYLAARLRGRKLSERHRQELNELSTLSARLQRQREYAESLRDANQVQMRRISAMSTQLDEATASFERVRHELAEKERQIAQLRSEMGASARQVELLSSQLGVARGDRNELRQAAERLAEANEAREAFRRKVDEAAAKERVLTARVDQKTAACLAAERMLQDSRSVQVRLRSELRAAMQDRRQLELQNLELKRVLDQLAGVSQTAPPAVASDPKQEPESFDALGAAEVTDTWEQVTVSEIHQVLGAIGEKPALPSGLLPDRSSAQLSSPEGALTESHPDRALLLSLRRQVHELETENTALRNANSGTFQAAKPVSGFDSQVREDAAAPLETAVLSDSLGLPIAGRGNLSSECLAAVSGLALSNAERVRELLPIGPITRVQWVDQYGMTVTCKFLNLSGDDMAMTTLGAGTPSEEALRATLKGVLSSIGWNEKGSESDDESNAAAG